MTKIKICGITREEEIEILNASEVDYAGFVVYEKSRRFLSVAQAQKIFGKLNRNIKRVAVTVSPDGRLIEDIAQAGFDVLQIHGGFDPASARRAGIPIWAAANLSGIDKIQQWRRTHFTEVDGILLDAGDYGSGKTFGWERESSGETRTGWQEALMEFQTACRTKNRTMILAGGLCAENVAEGIRLFAPDVVDVSSGVEEATDGRNKKSYKKVQEFVRAVQQTRKNQDENGV